MDKQIYIITKMKNRIFSFLLDSNGKAVEIHCDDENDTSVLGNVYIGRIKNIAKQINSAFVEISPGVTCYLPLDDLKNPIYTKKGSSPLPQQGDEIVVQVSREALKTKFPAVTTNITLQGKYLLLTTGNPLLSVSKKIDAEEKQRLRSMLEKMLQEDNKLGEDRGYGFLIRTNADGISTELLARDYRKLTNEYEKLVASAPYKSLYSIMHKKPAPYLKRLSNLYSSEVSRIIIEDPQIFSDAEVYIKENLPEDYSKLELYQDHMISAVKLYSLETQLEKALQERVWLDCGGYLVIQPTEALTVIDVNTGKCESGKDREKLFQKVNKEAAIELARQLRLRNISGIVIVDFINMKHKENYKELHYILKQELSKDPIPATFVDMTALTLAEITRKKIEKSLSELMR